MDHSIAYLMEFTSNPFEIKTIESNFSNQDKKEAFAKSESLMHNKEQRKISSFYKKISVVIKDYKQVLLFGPTNAKVELLDILKDDLRFAKIQIEIKETDKMKANQKNAFVKDYFSE